MSHVSTQPAFEAACWPAVPVQGSPRALTLFGKTSTRAERKYPGMKRQFVLCIDNKGFEASLIPGKIYKVIPDEKAEQDDFVRVIDESSEDYLYHQNHFDSKTGEK